MLSMYESDDFNKVLKLRGRKRSYFSKNKDDLKYPQRIKGTDIYVETNLSAEKIVRLAKDVISVMGHDDNLLRVECENKKSG